MSAHPGIMSIPKAQRDHAPRSLFINHTVTLKCCASRISAASTLMPKWTTSETIIRLKKKKKKNVPKTNMKNNTLEMSTDKGVSIRDLNLKLEESV